MGVWFSTLESKSLNPSFIEKIEKVMCILDKWTARRLTILGKTTIIKTLAASQIVYILSSLPTPPGVLKTINSILYDFLWDGKGDTIKRTTMINSYAKFILLRSVYIVCLAVLSCSNLKLHQTLEVKNIFKQEKIMLQ